MLLSLHGIVRPDPVTHANQVLASVRPQLHSHGGDVTLARVEDGIAFVRLEGVQRVLDVLGDAAQPRRRGSRARGSVDHRGRGAAQRAHPTLIPVESLRIGRDPASEGLGEVGPASGLAVDELSAVTLTAATGATVEVIVVNAGQRLSAYRNECAHEALPLNNAVLDLDSNTLTCPWHGFCYDATSGECLSAPGAQLEQLPLRVDDGDVWIRVTA